MFAVNLRYMSFLSDEIQRQMEVAKLSGLQVAAKINVSPSQLYNWVNGKQTSINASQLDSLSKALSNNLLDHATLLFAHLQDEKFGPAAKMIRIEIEMLDELREGPKAKSRGEKAILFLAESRMQAPEINDLVIDLARCLGAVL